MEWLKNPQKQEEVQVNVFEGEDSEITTSVKHILSQVNKNGDEAISRFTEKFDGVKMDTLSVERRHIDAAYRAIDETTLNAVKEAAKQIRTFASNQLSALESMEYESMPGVTLGHRLVPLSRVGCYIPAGRYPLPSSALMSIIPAKTAGVKHIMACAPPVKDKAETQGFPIHPLILVTMDIAGADEIFTMGGAQAIGAYTFGTETVTPADMIVGPGNKYVVEAKRQVNGIVGIDLLAGPSEVLIIADETADSQKVAMDLLATCEHDSDAVAMLVTSSKSFGNSVIETLKEELKQLETEKVARESWEKNGQVMICQDQNEAVNIANEKAPEHLQLMMENPEPLMPQLVNYGSLFVGHEAPVAFGDYISGTNHILPTNQSARHTNGLWVGSFIKVLSYQKVTQKGAESLAKTCSLLAEKEGLYAHKHSSDLRKT